MTRYLLVIMFSIALNSVHAQYPGYSPVRDLVAFNNQFAAAAQSTHSIKSDFIQEKNLSMLSEKIISKGKFYFEKDSKVRMDYVHPFTYTMIINNNKVFIRDGKKENTINAKSNKLFQQIIRITLDCVQGTAIKNTDFRTRVFESRNNYLVELTPVTKGLKDFFQSIRIVVERKDNSVSQIDMVEASGDNTLIRFTNRELNAPIPASIFVIK